MTPKPSHLRGTRHMMYTYKGMHITPAQLDRVLEWAYLRMLEDKKLKSHGQSRTRTVELPPI